MTTAMDFGIPDLSTGRDPAPDPTRRRDRAGGADFATILDQSLDAPDEPPRDRAAASEPAAGEKIREKPHRPEHVENERKPSDRDPAATNDQVADEAAEPATAGPTPEIADGAPATTTDAPEAALLAAATPTETAQATPEPQVVAAATAPAVEPKSPKAAPVDPATAFGNAAQPAPAGAAGSTETPSTTTASKPDVAAPTQPLFAEQLASATGKPADAAPVPTKSKNDAAPVADAAKPAVAEATIAAAVSAAAGTASDNRARHDSPNGNAPPQHPSAQANPATPPSPQPAPTSAQPASATPAQPAAEPVDDAQLLAIVRAPAPPAAAARPTIAEPPTMPLDGLQKESAFGAKVTAEPAKAETPRPFGALAPGLGLAAQITAQQTPEQAQAAERLAQLAAAAADDTAALVPSEDADIPAETAAPSLRADQPALVDTPASRQAAADVAATAAATRSARPAFHPVVMQVAAQVAQAAADGTDRINIRLSPAELGRIDVKLDFGPDGRVQAVFAAERPQTMELLQRDARDLERALQDAGLRADSGSLSFNLRGNGRDNRDDQTPSGGPHDGTSAEIVASQLQAYSAGAGGSGRLDIRI